MELLPKDIIWKQISYLSLDDLGILSKCSFYRKHIEDQEFQQYYSDIHHLRHGYQIVSEYNYIDEGLWIFGYQYGLHKITYPDKALIRHIKYDRGHPKTIRTFIYRSGKYVEIT